MEGESDSDDPFAMMAGMGEEEVCQVTLVDQADVSADKALTPLEGFLRQVELYLLDIEATPPEPELPPECQKNADLQATCTSLLRVLPFGRRGELQELLADAWLEPLAAVLTREAVVKTVEQGGLQQLRWEICRACSEFVAAAPEGTGEVRALGLLLLAVTSLQLYIRANWTGPSPDDVGPFSLAELWPPTPADKEMLESLEIDGEPAYELLRGPGYLWFALGLLGMLPSASGGVAAAAAAGGQTLPIWRGRAAFAWQLSLADASERGFGQCPRLFELSVCALVGAAGRPGALVGAGLLADDALEGARGATANVLKHWKDGDNAAAVAAAEEAAAEAAARTLSAGSGGLRAALVVELVVRLCWYGREKPFEEMIQAACKAAGSFNFEVTGVMGIKREYQTVEYAQLMCKTSGGAAGAAAFAPPARPAEATAAAAQADEEKAPEQLSLKVMDDMNDVLEQPKFSASMDQAERDMLEKPLASTEQVILLAKCNFVWLTSNPNDELVLQEINALAQRILQTEKKPVEGGELGDGEMLTANWLSFSCGLWYRCKAEHHRNKTRERAAFQLQSLVDQFEDKKPSPGHRLLLAHSAGYPARFHMQREMGTRMMRMGMVSTAHEQYKKLRMWPEAVDCLMCAERNVEAQDMIKELLEQAPTPRLWCCLGDLLKEPKHFETAWELSNKRFARAQRSLGRHYMNKDDLEKACDAYKLALDINPLHSDIWFSKGVAEMRLKRWDDAVITFNRCLAVQDENAEAWANLAAVHSARGGLKEARSCMYEATKRAPQSWKMWESFMGVCMQLRDIQGVIRSMRRLVDINHFHRIQERVVGMVTTAVINDTDGLYEGRTGKAFSLQLDSFFVFLSSKVSSAPFVWRFWAELQDSADQGQKALDSRFKHHRALQARIWEERDPDRFSDYLVDLVDCFEVVARTLARPNFAELAKEHVQPFALTTRDAAKRLDAKMDTGLDDAPAEWKEGLAKIIAVADSLEAQAAGATA